MALKTMIANLIEAKKKYDDQLKELGEGTARALAEEVGPLLPPGHVLAWRQYTPYFNDGEACTFGVGDAYLIRVDAQGRPAQDEDVETDDDYEVLESIWDALREETGIHINHSITERYGKPDEEVPTSWGGTYTRRGIPLVEGYPAEKLAALVELWRSLPEDMLEAAFGDHAQCAIRPDGSHERRNYDHD